MSLSRQNSRRRLISEGANRSRRTTYRRSTSRRLSSLSIPFWTDIDIYINGGFEPEDEEEIEAEIGAIDQIFVPPVQLDESMLSEEELRRERRKAQLTFALGCLMAFTSGLTLTVNNFIVKATGTDFGEIMAVRGLMQIPIMLSIIACQGDLKKILAPNWYYQCLVILVGIFGAFTMVSTFACVKFMPVGDAMTLIFTNPLFTLIFAAIFLGHRLTFIKNISALVLMVGIVLVTKPPFLFPNQEPESQDKNSTVQFLWYALTWSDSNDEDSGDYYFVGAIIALSSAIFSASNNIVIAKIGQEVPKNVQLLYIGFFGLIVACFCQLLDENDRFFSAQITEIPLSDIGVAMGVGSIGLFGFFCTVRSLTMIPPSTVATLRTSQIFVAFIAQVIISQVIPSALDIIGALSIFMSALAITFEVQIYKAICGRCTCSRRSEMLFDE